MLSHVWVKYRRLQRKASIKQTLYISYCSGMSPISSIKTETEFDKIWTDSCPRRSVRSRTCRPSMPCGCACLHGWVACVWTRGQQSERVLDKLSSQPSGLTAVCCSRRPGRKSCGRCWIWLPCDQFLFQFKYFYAPTPWMEFGASTFWPICETSYYLACIFYL